MAVELMTLRETCGRHVLASGSRLVKKKKKTEELWTVDLDRSAVEGFFIVCV